MARAGLDKNIVVEKAAQLANQIGIDNIQLKTLAESLNIGLLPKQKTKKKGFCHRIAADYAALLLISKGVRPFFKLMRSKL